MNVLAALSALIAGWASAPSTAYSDPIYKSRGYFAFDPYTPMFSSAQAKLAKTRDPRFTASLLTNVVDYEPLFLAPGTQAHMGFWSGSGNRGNLVRLLDDINFGSTRCARGPTPNCAVWDEGATTSEQFPLYVEMLVEHWYDRGNAPAGSPVITIYGKRYYNTNSVDFPTADRIWGQYSQRYTEMARPLYRSTGKQVKAWCFVMGAGSDRVFYTYEYPKLQELEREGVVTVYCAKNANANWRKPDDWTVGTGSAACPDPRSPAVQSTKPETIINVYNR